MQPDAAPDDDRYYAAVECHVFTFNDRCLLLDVESLAVHRLAEGCRLLLEANGAPGSEMKWCSQGIAAGLTEKAALDSFRSLKELGIIVPEGFCQETKATRDLPQASDYVFMVNVAQTCNLRCAYCYTHEGTFDFAHVRSQRMSEELATKTVRFVTGQFPKAKILCFHFLWGEPLINFAAIRALVEETTRTDRSDCSFEFAITTNGTLLTREIADFMDKYRFTVFFSIDGPAKVHDKFRIFPSGRGSYDIVKRNYDYLKTKPNIKLIGSSVVRSDWTLPQAEQFLTGIGVDQFKAERVRVGDDDSLALSPQEHEQFIMDLDSLFEIYVGALHNNVKPLDYRLSSKILQLWTRTKRRHFCPAGERMFGISAEGEVYPCALHAGRPMSLLGTLEEGLDLSKIEEFTYRTSVQGQKTCSCCWNRNLCGGGCSAMTDRFGHEECDILRKKSQIAIAIFDEISHEDELRFLNLVSPRTLDILTAIDAVTEST